MTMTNLTERVEKATGPDRELDREIANKAHGYANDGSVPRFTASLDAALTLVPEGLDWTLDWIGERSAAWVLASRFRASGAAMTPALALCAAALRAKATAHREDT